MGFRTLPQLTFDELLSGYISAEGRDRLAASPFSERSAAGKERALLSVRSVYLVITMEKRP